MPHALCMWELSKHPLSNCLDQGSFLDLNCFHEPASLWEQLPKPPVLALTLLESDSSSARHSLASVGLQVPQSLLLTKTFLFRDFTANYCGVWRMLPGNHSPDDSSELSPSTGIAFPKEVTLSMVTSKVFNLP